jgi:hypothetical protein
MKVACWLLMQLFPVRILQTDTPLGSAICEFFGLISEANPLGEISVGLQKHVPFGSMIPKEYVIYRTDKQYHL